MTSYRNIEEENIEKKKKKKRDVRIVSLLEDSLKKVLSELDLIKVRGCIAGLIILGVSGLWSLVSGVRETEHTMILVGVNESS